MRTPLLSPFHANGFPVQLSAFYSASPLKDPDTRRRPIVLRAMLAIDAREFTFKDAQSGRKELNLDVVAAAYGPDNEMVSTSDKTFRAAISPEEMRAIIASGLLYDLDLAISKPGPYQLRVAARDANSDRIGASTLFVAIPDFNGRQLAMSSIQLHDSDAKRNQELTSSGNIGAGSPVTRVFSRGAVLEYDCTIFGGSISESPASLRSIYKSAYFAARNASSQATEYQFPSRKDSLRRCALQVRSNFRRRCRPATTPFS